MCEGFWFTCCFFFLVMQCSDSWKDGNGRLIRINLATVISVSKRGGTNPLGLLSPSSSSRVTDRRWCPAAFDGEMSRSRQFKNNLTDFLRGQGEKIPRENGTWLPIIPGQLCRRATWFNSNRSRPGAKTGLCPCSAAALFRAGIWGDGDDTRTFNAVEIRQERITNQVDDKESR